MKTPKITILLVVLFFGLTGAKVSAQTILDQYVKTGIENNLVLKQKMISLEKAMFSLKIANSYFFPTVQLLADYTSGEGGRSINIPVGDMLNSVYSTLNQLTQSNNFPQIENVKEDFFPNQFYDIKLRTTVPIINTDLIFNKQIQSGLVKLQEFEVSAYKRELIKEIKTSYFNYLSLLHSIGIYKAALETAMEGKRVNESLLKNGAGLPVYVLRAENEIETIKSKLTEAEKQTSNAGRYFNFLLNRDLDDKIIADSEIEMTELMSPIVNTKSREELQMFIQNIYINNSMLNMNRFDWIPKINAFIDFGAQDSKFHYDSKSRYYLFGFQLSIPLFESFRNSHKINQAELELKNTELGYEKLKKQLDLSAGMAVAEFETAKQNYISSLKQLETAKNYHKLISRGYNEGVNSFIETVDARNQLTQAELLVNINKFLILSAKAKYERENALNQKEIQ